VIMPYFLIDEKVILSNSFAIKGKEMHHIMGPRRVRIGEEIEIQDSSQVRFLCKVTRSTKREIELSPLKVVSTPKEPELQINLFQALLKEKAMKNIIQKVTELGVCRIIIIETTYSQRFTSKDHMETHLASWNKVALEACKQSGRVKPPEIIFSGSINELLYKPNFHESDFFCLHTDCKSNVRDFYEFSGKVLNLLIGPEGGFSEEEINNKNIHQISLGPRILRGDTAATIAVGIAQFLFGDMSKKVNFPS